MTCEWLQHVSGQISQIKKKDKGYRESKTIKALRSEVKAERDPRRAAEKWKTIWKKQKQEKKEFNRELAERAMRKIVGRSSNCERHHANSSKSISFRKMTGGNEQ